jgi:hypothetical protein
MLSSHFPGCCREHKEPPFQVGGLVLILNIHKYHTYDNILCSVGVIKNTPSAVDFAILYKYRTVIALDGERPDVSGPIRSIKMYSYSMLNVLCKRDW